MVFVYVYPEPLDEMYPTDTVSSQLYQWKKGEEGWGRGHNI